MAFLRRARHRYRSIRRTYVRTYKRFMKDTNGRSFTPFPRYVTALRPFRTFGKNIHRESRNRAASNTTTLDADSNRNVTRVSGIPIKKRRSRREVQPRKPEKRAFITNDKTRRGLALNLVQICSNRLKRRFRPERSSQLKH